jgi:hypothetical protein
MHRNVNEILIYAWHVYACYAHAQYWHILTTPMPNKGTNIRIFSMGNFHNDKDKTHNLTDYTKLRKN